MAGLLDSIAVLQAKATECGLSQELFQHLEDQNVNSLGKLAFVFGQPNETVADAELRNLIQHDPTTLPTMGEVGAARRFLFTAQTLAVGEMKKLVEETSESTKKRACWTRENRENQGTSRSTIGLNLEGEIECAFSSYDLVMDMMERDTVLYLSPHKFVSRRSELAYEKMIKELVIEPGNNIKVKDKKHDLSCETGTELTLSQALTRRALAFDLVGACSFNVMSKYNDFLISQMQETPPAGYSKITVQQVLQADCNAWQRLPEKLGSGVKVRADGVRPLDEEIPLLRADPKFAFHLLPRLWQQAMQNAVRILTQGLLHQASIAKLEERESLRGKTLQPLNPYPKPCRVKWPWRRQGNVSVGITTWTVDAIQEFVQVKLVIEGCKAVQNQVAASLTLWLIMGKAVRGNLATDSVSNNFSQRPVRGSVGDRCETYIVFRNFFRYRTADSCHTSLRVERKPWYRPQNWTRSAVSNYQAWSHLAWSCGPSFWDAGWSWPCVCPYGPTVRCKFPCEGH